MVTINSLGDQARRDSDTGEPGGLTPQEARSLRKVRINHASPEDSRRRGAEIWLTIQTAVRDPDLKKSKATEAKRCPRITRAENRYGELAGGNRRGREGRRVMILFEGRRKGMSESSSIRATHEKRTGKSVNAAIAREEMVAAGQGEKRNRRQKLACSAKWRRKVDVVRNSLGVFP